MDALLEFRNFQGATPEQLRAWLRAILIHKVANTHRRYKQTAMRNVGREQPLPIPWPGGLPGEGLSGDDSTPAGKAKRREEQARLDQALAQLPEHYREVVVAHLHENRSFAEIGRCLGRTEDAAKQLWLRALQRLEREMISNRHKST
jgi:RNA polymerase sigma-70 factor (ECF subfamily)